jgi:hypothetical protein
MPSGRASGKNREVPGPAQQYFADIRDFPVFREIFLKYPFKIIWLIDSIPREP